MKPLPQTVHNILQVRNSGHGWIGCRVLRWIWDRPLSGDPPKSPDLMVVVTGGPPLTLLLTILIVLFVLGRLVPELVPDVKVLEESPLITVMENWGISGGLLSLLEGVPLVDCSVAAAGLLGVGMMTMGRDGAGGWGGWQDGLRWRRRWPIRSWKQRRRWRW